MKHISVNVVSETVFTVRGHGVHTAYQEHLEALKKYTSYKVTTNSTQSSDIVHVHTIGPYSWRKFRQAKYGAVMHAHVTPGSFIGSLRAAKLWAPAAHLYLRWIYNKADAVICVSPQVKKELINLKVKSKLVIIPNMIEVANFKRPTMSQLNKLRKQFSVPDDRPCIVASGQVQPRKGAQDFIDMALDQPDYHFLWIGGIPFGKLGEKTADMEQLMKNAPENVTFTGVVELEVARQLYHLGTIFWLASYQETFGLVVIEAAACGLPVILRDLPVYKKIFNDSYLIANSLDQCKKNIISLLSNKATYKQWQARSLQLADDYSSAHRIKEYTAVYAELIGPQS